MKVLVCGGGNIAHSLAAAITRSQDVCVFTRRPQIWSRHLNDNVFGVEATSDGSIVATADMIFVSVPRFAFQDEMQKIDPYLRPGQLLCVTPGSDAIPGLVEKYAPRGVTIACIQRVPYISRIEVPGRRVRMSGPRTRHRVYVSDERRRLEVCKACLCFFEADVEYLHSPMTFVFNNSNPLLHPSRLVVLFDNWRHRFYDRNPGFYTEWTDESSRLYLSADCEMFEAVKRMDDSGACLQDYESVRMHYGVQTAEELTVKLRSIVGFQGISSPMKMVGACWIPDFSSRYFTEDIPFGTKAILMHAQKLNVSVPTIANLIQNLERIQCEGLEALVT